MFKNSSRNHAILKTPQLWFVILIIAVGWSRYLPLSHPELFNFTPVLALFFISGVFLKGHWSWIGPVSAVVVSDLILNPSYGANLFETFTLISLVVYIGIFALGKSIGKSPRAFPLFTGALASALVFHVITCGFAWLVNPAYVKTVAGFWQAQFLGEPGYAPAYLFLRNSVLSTLLFTGIFYWVFEKNMKEKIKTEKVLKPSGVQQIIG
jgi:hypothetical protein